MKHQTIVLLFYVTMVSGFAGLNEMRKSTENINNLLDDFECTGLDIDELFQRAAAPAEVDQ